MNKASFYPKLAFQNIKNNRKFYIPYMLTGVIITMMFYIVMFLAKQDSLGYKYADGGVYGGQYLESFLVLGAIIIAIFSVIFLFYTNSFLIKRRQKEFGLYIVLGMEKRHLALVQFYETFYAALVSIVGGLGCGILFSKLAVLLCCKVMHYQTAMGFSVSFVALGATFIVFLVIFALILIKNIVTVGKLKPVELLHSGNVGEKEPKSKWLLTILGVLCLGGGYAIAVLVKSPLSAIALFFVAVLLVIFGTYMLFTTGSVTLLKSLKNNKNYYYKTRHFISVSGMIYRMKQNAVGLANICILSTMVLVMISSTVTLNVGMEDSLGNRYPADIMLTYYNPSPDIGEVAATETAKYFEGKGIKYENLKAVTYLTLGVTQQGDEFTAIGHYAPLNTGDSSGELYIITDEEYSKRTGKDISLADGEAIVETQDFPVGDSFRLFGDEYTVVEHTKGFPVEGSTSVEVLNLTSIAVNKATFDQINAAQKTVYEENSSNVVAEVYVDIPNVSNPEQIEIYNDYYNYMVDTVTSGYEYDETTGEAIEPDPADINYTACWGNSAAEGSADMYGLYGSFLFLGIFLSILFIMASILIMYYKQLTEGYNDKDRFEIMQKVGLSKDEIKRSIRSQILVVFFLPLAAAVLHMAFAFRIITKLLSVLGLTNVPLFIICTLCTIAVFAIIYAIVYALTAKEYYKIVSTK